MLPLAASAQDTFTPQHIAKLRVVTEAVISPDGTQVAYVLAVPRNIPKEKDGPPWTDSPRSRLPKAKKAQLDQGFNQEIYEEDAPFVRVWLASLPRKGGEDDAKPGSPPPANAGGSQMLDLKGSASESSI